MAISLKYEKRTVLGRKVKSLRKEGFIPANIFGKKIKSEAVSIKVKEFDEVFKKAGETQIIDLGGKPVLISNFQVDPVTSQVLHVDFRQVDLTEKITAKIPVLIIGESPAEKQGIGTVVTQVDEIEVEALPTDLPEKVEVDVSILTEVDQAIYVKDIKLGSKVGLITESEQIVVKVEPPQKEEVIETPATPAEGETNPEAPVEGKEQSPTETKVEDKPQEK